MIDRWLSAFVCHRGKNILPGNSPYISVDPSSRDSIQGIEPIRVERSVAFKIFKYFEMPHHILSFYSEQEDHEWAEGEGRLASLIPLRAELMQGDRRCLYLAWLLGVQRGELDYESLEPPIPTGLGELSATLQSFMDFLCIDPDLVTAAAEKSAAKDSFALSKEEIAKWVDSLPDNDKHNLLMRLLDSDEPHIGVELRQRALREIRGVNQVDNAPVHGGNLRNAGQLVTRAKEISAERHEKEAKRRAQEKLRRGTI